MLPVQNLNVSQAQPVFNAQPSYTPRGTNGVTPKVWRPEENLGRPYPVDSRPQPRLQESQVLLQASQARPQPNLGAKPVRSVEERHAAFLRASEALHDRHYEDNNLRLEAELRLAEFFLS